MATLSLIKNVRSKFKHLIILLILAAGQGGLEWAYAQPGTMSTSPATGRPEFGGNPPADRTDSGALLQNTYGSNPVAGQGVAPMAGRVPEMEQIGDSPYSTSTGSTETGQGGGTQTSVSMQGVADEQPTLAPGARQPNNGAGQGDVTAMSLKSVPYPAHPIYDFLATVKRSPSKERPEKDTYLCEVLSGVTSPSHRRELIKAYWDLSEKMLKSHVRLAQRQRLQIAYERLQTNEVAKTEIQLAYQLVSQQYLALELEFVQAQYHFADLQARCSPNSQVWRSSYASDSADCETENSSLALRPETRPLPIPVEFPLAVPYDTKVKEIEKVRTLSQKSLLLDHTIPLQYETIVARTAAKNFADRQWDATLKFGQSPVSQIEALAQEEINLVGTIIEYNRQVNDYVAETFGASIPEKQLLASILVLQIPTTNANPPQNP